MGALIDYLDITQKGHLPFLKTPVKENKEKILQIDPATRRNLEILRNLKGEKAGSLLTTIDKTQTSPGARLLERWLSGPSTDLTLIKGRLDCVRLFYKNKDLRERVQNLLKETPDLGRILTRLSIDRSGPRDLSSIKNGLVQAEQLNQEFSNIDLPDLIKEKNGVLIGFSDTILMLSNALDENPPQLIKDGNFIKKGFSQSLDEHQLLKDDNKKIISQLQASYVEKTGISSLKIKYNNVLGYFIETTTNHSEKMFSQGFSDLFIHRQTTANSVRFTTIELSSLETKLLNATGAISSLEKEIFDTLKGSVLSRIVPLTYLASTLAEIDVFCSLGYLASDSEWVEPKLDQSRDFKIVSGRHPVVETSINRTGNTPFVSNSCNLSAIKGGANIWLLTGPNMSGKSTFLRQNALIAILAQIGSYVPAAEAKIGLFSQVFSRVGASDDLARGRSTFMVEMVETAAILNQADDRALVILDEIGRGTSTYDGLSIAWATLEHLHSKNKCRALFATHYHELTATSKTLESVQNATVAVKEWEGEIIFLHTVKSGSADRSYGVQVAKLAGLPSSVIKRAQFILNSLENSSKKNNITDSLPLFSSPINHPKDVKKLDPLRVKLRNSNPDSLSPKDALQLLYELKDLQGVEETPT
jgi:DNA mismatch repair protein MutS